jgi:nitrite reductase (NADH) small subunit
VSISQYRCPEELMSDFITLAHTGEIPEGQGRCFPVGGTMVGVFLDQGTYFAINDFCPHMGASLSEGYVEEGLVMCPWHAWRFRLCDGTWMDNSKSGIRSASYELRIVDSEIQLRVDSEGKPFPREITTA